VTHNSLALAPSDAFRSRAAVSHRAWLAVALKSVMTSAVSLPFKLHLKMAVAANARSTLSAAR
jgi:hypothetical protein